MTLPGLSHDASLLAFAGLAVIGLVVLVAWLRWNAFVALLVASIFVGVAAKLPPGEIAKGFQDGLGATLSSVAAVIALGAMIGGLLAESGGAAVVAKRLAETCGPRFLPWSMFAVAILIGVPTWFVVGLVLLMPILANTARTSGVPFLRLGVPVIAALSTMHSMTPPHPGAMAAVAALNADVGQTILWTLALGIPSAALAGPVYGRWIARRLAVAVPAEKPRTSDPQQPPGFALTVFTILLPILLMLGASLASTVSPSPWWPFLGHPVVAMLLAVLFSLWSLGTKGGLPRAAVAKVVEGSLLPVGAILLVVGGGGGFSKVLQLSGTGEAIADMAKNLPFSLLLLGWLMAALLRLAVGSSTVAITTTAGLLTPLLAGSAGTNPALLVAVLGAGSLFGSHVNDGGFWFVKECFQMSLSETVKTWSVATMIASVAALLLALAADAVW